MIKSIIKLVIFIISIPFSTTITLLYKLKIFSFKTSSIIVSKAPGYFGIALRQVFYKLTLSKCGKNLRVFYGAYIVYPSVEIGNNCTIEEYSIISNCIIGNDVIIAARVSIMSGNKHHDIMDIKNTFYESKSLYKKVQLGDNLWIGTHAIIMNDICSNSVIGAGSVVTKVVPQYVVVAGSPAKIIKLRK